MDARVRSATPAGGVSAGARHIVVDGRELTGRPTGVGRCVLEILAAWARMPHPHRVSVIVPRDTPAALAALAGRVDVHMVPARSTGTWFEQTQLPGHVRRLGGDVLFAPAYTAPLRASCPVVLMVHDVSFFAHPEWFNWREGLRRRLLTRAAARAASRVITVSEFSRREIERYLGIPAASILVAPNGAPPIAVDVPVRREPIVLYAGTLLARRHIRDLIEAFAIVAGVVPNARLVLVGQDRSVPPIDPAAMARSLGLEHKVTWRPYVEWTELRRLYSTARVFAFLSDYEGFAMTPMEAIAHGAPVVLADTAVAREVYADGATYVTPEPRAIASALLPLLVDDRANAELLARGQARLSHCSWDASARAIMTTLERA